MAVDQGGISACYQQGILEVRLPRHRPRHIPVRAIREDNE
jgi:HSP20 family molecular chaperone IbpA